VSASQIAAWQLHIAERGAKEHEEQNRFQQKKLTDAATYKFEKIKYWKSVIEISKTHQDYSVDSHGITSTRTIIKTHLQRSATVCQQSYDKIFKKMKFRKPRQDYSRKCGE
jgi:hypothetical protein